MTQYDARIDRPPGRLALTMIEIMIVVAIIGTLVVLAYPFYRRYMTRTQLVKAIRDMRVIEEELTVYELANGNLPDSLEAIDRHTFQDPWGHPYQYLKYANYVSTDLFRKERFLFPLNEEYDLYSNGPDGQSEPELSAPASLDDIVRANDGTFIGPASEF